ncbi:hypothetical protein [Borrelia hermsii]|uniref:hypothetical protein n=1 Tax=Borrelia hermsii TaxID=140 RepID=UPI0004B3092D|nr:hypothetical protein [Borrelia hermsii]
MHLFAVTSNLVDLCFVVMYGMGVAAGVIIGDLMLKGKKYVRALGMFGIIL